MKRADELSFELARAAVAQLSPAELPVLDGLGIEFVEASSAPTGGDGALGFDVTQLTFAVVASQCAVASASVVAEFFKAAAGESGTSLAKALASRIKQRRQSASAVPKPPVPLDPALLMEVRKRAFEQARQSGLDESAAKLMADALVGSLVAQ
ncbi:hypothetical protein BVC93_23945 [Mycobacterium sp. MS1601]|nr:hypothetical protein BVC93_23945 [Mycobacterium sp. MS1601]